MEYITVKDGIVVNHSCGAEVPKGAIACPKGFAGNVGDKVEDFNSDFSAYTKEKIEEKTETPAIEEQSEPTEEQLAFAFLQSTDWYVTRFAETGKPIPEEISKKRAECRETLSKQNAVER